MSTAVTAVLEAQQAVAGEESASAGVSSWVLDTAHTLVEFSAKHMMFTTVKGRFGAFQGEIRFDDARPERSQLAVEIEAASLDTRNEQRDAHLRSADFLHAEEYPAVTFRSTRLVVPEGAALQPGLEFQVIGDLTIRGTTRPVTLNAIYHGQSTGPWGNQIRGFSASTRINRRDFDLTWNVALETGGWLVGDEIKIELEAQANPKPAEGA